MVQKVTFKVMLDTLTSGNYITSEGNIVKTELNNRTVSVYVSTDIPAHTTQNLIITPDSPRKGPEYPVPQIYFRRVERNYCY